MNQFKDKVDETVTSVLNRQEKIEDRVRIKQAENPLEVNEEWHAELTEDALLSVEKLQTFVQDEVYLQFAHHFRKLSKLREVK